MFGELAIAKMAVLFVALVAIISLPLAVISVQQNQDIRQQAAVAPPPSPTLVTCHTGLGPNCTQRTCQTSCSSCGSQYTIGSCPALGCGGECDCNCHTDSRNDPPNSGNTCGNKTRIGIKVCDGDGNGQSTNCEDYCSAAPPIPTPSPTATPPTSPNPASPTPSPDPTVGPCCIGSPTQITYVATCQRSQRVRPNGATAVADPTYAPTGPSACVLTDGLPTALNFSLVNECGSTPGFCNDPDGCTCPVFCANRNIIRNQYCGVPSTQTVSCYNKQTSCSAVNVAACDGVTYFTTLPLCQAAAGITTCYIKASNCAASPQQGCNETTAYSSLATCQAALCPAGSTYNPSGANVCKCNVAYGSMAANPYFNPTNGLPELCTPATCSLTAGRPTGCSCTAQNQCASGSYCESSTGKCTVTSALPLCPSAGAACVSLSGTGLSGGILCRNTTDQTTPNSCCRDGSARVGSSCVTNFSCDKMDTAGECNSTNDSLDCTWKTKAANPGLPVDICVATTLKEPAADSEACCVNGVDSNVTKGKCTTAPIYGVLGRCAAQPVKQLSSCNETCYKGQTCRCPVGCVADAKNNETNHVINNANGNLGLTCGGLQQVQCCVNGTTQMVDPGVCSGTGKTLGVCNVKVNLTSCTADCTSASGCTCPAGCKNLVAAQGGNCGKQDVITCCYNGSTQQVAPSACTGTNAYLGACGTCYFLNGNCAAVSRSSCDNVTLFSDQNTCTTLASTKLYQDGPPCSIVNPSCSDPKKICAITDSGAYKCLDKSPTTVPISDINPSECSQVNLGGTCLTSAAASQGQLADDGTCIRVGNDIACVKKGVVLRVEIKPGQLCTRTEECYCQVNNISYAIDYLKQCPSIGLSTCSADGAVSDQADKCCTKVLHFDDFLKKNVCGPSISIDNPLVNGNSCDKASGGCTCKYNQCQCRVGEQTSTILGGQLCYNKSRDTFKPEEICGENYCKGTCETRQLDGQNYAVCNEDGFLTRDYYLIQPGQKCPATSKGCYCRNQLLEEGQTCRVVGTELSLVETCMKYCNGDDWCAQDGITITCRPGRLDSYKAYTMDPNKAGDVCNAPATCQTNSCTPAVQTIGNSSGKCAVDNLNYCCTPNKAFTNCSLYFAEDPSVCNSHPECEYTNLGGKVDCYNKAVSQPEKVLPPAESCTSICTNALGCSCTNCAKASTSQGLTCGGAAPDIAEGFKEYLQRWSATFHAIQQGNSDALPAFIFQVLDTVSLGQAGWGVEAQQAYSRCMREVADGTRDAEANCVSEAVDVAYSSIQISATAIEVVRGVTSFVDDIYNTYVRQPYLRSQVAAELAEGSVFVDESGQAYRVGKNGSYTAIDASEIPENSIPFASEADGAPCIPGPISSINQEMASQTYSSVLGTIDIVGEGPLADLNPCKTRRYKVTDRNDVKGVSKELGGKRVGGGAFASVYVDPEDPNIYIKVFLTENLEEGISAKIVREEILGQIEALKKANGAGGLPRIRGYVFDSSGQMVGYAMEKIDGLTVRQAQGFFSGVRMTKEQVKSALDQVKEAQEILGGPHGDLNIGNVIIKSDKSIGIIDPLGIFTRDGSEYAVQKAAEEITTLQQELIKICSDCGKVSDSYFQQ